MSYVNKGWGDDRAHTTAREKRTQSRQIVDYARKLMLADQPAGVEPCNECLAQHLMLALRELSADIARGDLEYEKRGVASRLEDFSADCGEMRNELVSSAGGAKPRRRGTPEDFVRALLAA